MIPPYPYFGGKRAIASRVWEMFGEGVKRYIEPFFGGGAVLLGRPDWKPGMDEIVCDIDCVIPNFWRALKWHADETAEWASWPNVHADLTARVTYLRTHLPELQNSMAKDMEYCNPKFAGIWCWCATHWLGGNMLHDYTKKSIPSIEKCARRDIPGICSNKRPRVDIKTPSSLRQDGLKNHPHDAEQCAVATSESSVIMEASEKIRDMFTALSKRFVAVKVVNGDWSRVLGGKWQGSAGVCAVFLDPPYSFDNRDCDLYRQESGTVAADVRKWCIERGDEPNLRIILCGYGEEHDELLKYGWGKVEWKAQGGLANAGHGDTRGKVNRNRERLWFKNLPKTEAQMKMEI